MRVRFAGTLTGWAAVLLAFAAPGASASWSGITPLTDPVNHGALNESGLYPEIATDGVGDQTAAWYEVDPDPPHNYRVVASSSNADGTWTRTPFLSTTPANLNRDRDRIALAEGPDGTALVGWTVGSNHALAAAFRNSLSNPFGTETPLTGTTHCTNNATLTNDDAYGLTAGLGQGGSGWIAWTASCGGGSDAPIVHLRRVTAGGFEGPITVVKPTGESGVLVGPQMAVDRDSAAANIAVTENTYPGPIRTRKVTTDGVVGSPTAITPGPGPNRPRIGILPDHTVAAVFQDGAGGVGFKEGGADPVRINPIDQGVNISAPEIAVSKDGTIAVVWRDNDERVWARVRPPNGGWGTATALSEPASKDYRVGISDNGIAYVIWAREIGDLVGVEGFDHGSGRPDPLARGPLRLPAHPRGHRRPAGRPLPDARARRRPIGPARGREQRRRDGHHLVEELAGPRAGHAIDRRAALDDPAARRRARPRSARSRADDAVDSHGPTAPAPSPVPGKPPPDLRAPALTVFSATRTVFAVGSKEGKLVAHYKDPTVIDRPLRKGLRVGTVLGWTQDEAGKAKLTITKTGCWATTPKGKKFGGLKVCHGTKQTVVYKATLTAKRGGNRLTYLGETSKGKKLEAGGKYRADLVALDAAGNVSKKKSLTLSIDEPI